jgi:small subunit ribosomal protein S17
MAETATQTRDIGLDVAKPAKTCTSDRCPFHGNLKVRGAQLVGKIVSLKMQGTAVIEKERSHYIQKYQRYERRTSRLTAHLPSCIGAQVGDEVRIMECRPLSKTVAFVVIERRAPQ